MGEGRQYDGSDFAPSDYTQGKEFRVRGAREISDRASMGGATHWSASRSIASSAPPRWLCPSSRCERSSSAWKCMLALICGGRMALRVSTKLWQGAAVERVSKMSIRLRRQRRERPGLHIRPGGSHDEHGQAGITQHRHEVTRVEAGLQVRGAPTLAEESGVSHSSLALSPMVCDCVPAMYGSCTNALSTTWLNPPRAPTSRLMVATIHRPRRPR